MKHTVGYLITDQPLPYRLTPIIEDQTQPGRWIVGFENHDANILSTKLQQVGVLKEKCIYEYKRFPVGEMK